MSHANRPSASEPWSPPTVEELQAALPQFEILSQLGEGGMGAVFKARQPSLDRIISIKILPEALTRDEHAALRLDERFRREARSLARLDHPSITTVHDFGQADNGMHYLVMEFVDGMDLHSYLHYRGGIMPVEEVLYVGLRVLEALSYAHGQGILHRDIKPANILVRRDDGLVKLVDFGLAKSLSATSNPKDAPLTPALTLSEVAVGTPDYVPPESMLNGVELDARADIYSLGVTLYQLLTGRVPKGKLKAVSGIVPQVDSRIDPIVERAIEMEPDDRFQSADEFHRALLALTGEGTNPTDALDLAAAGGQPNLNGPSSETPREVVLLEGNGTSTAAAAGTSGASAAMADSSNSSPGTGSAASASASAAAPDDLNRRSEARIRAATIRLVAAAVIIILAAILGLWRPWEKPPVGSEEAVSGDESVPHQAENHGAALPTTDPESSAEPDRPGDAPATLPKDGVVRAWGLISQRPLDLASIEQSFGKATRYEQIMAAANRYVVARSDDSRGAYVSLAQPKQPTEARSIDWLDRDNHAWVSDGYLRHDTTEIDTNVLEKTRKVFSAGLFGYFYLDDDWKLQLYDWSKAPGGRKPMESIVEALQRENVVALTYLHRYQGSEQRVAALTSDNRLRTWSIAENFTVTELEVEQPEEPIAEIASAGREFGAWIARAESGNVYTEEPLGFSKPVEALSPAEKIRTDDGIIAVQRPDGSWTAAGKDAQFVEAIEAVGVAADLDILYNEYKSAVIPWLDPDPSRSFEDVAATLPTAALPKPDVTWERPPTGGQINLEGKMQNQPINVIAMANGLGDLRPMRSLEIGPSGYVISIDEEGRARFADARKPDRTLNPKKIDFFDDQNATWFTSGALRHGSVTVAEDLNIDSDQLLVASVYGYIYRDEEGALQMPFWDNRAAKHRDSPPGGREALQSILDALPAEEILTLNYYSLDRGKYQIIGAVTRNNRALIHQIDTKGRVSEVSLHAQPQEPIKRILNGGSGLGRWVALAESGNVYCEDTGGFEAPIEELSPAWKLRGLNGTLAAQRQDGTWAVRGPNRKLKERIEKLGPVADLAFTDSAGWWEALAWLSPYPFEAEQPFSLEPDAGLPQSGYLRLWKEGAAADLDAEQIERAFGKKTPYREVMLAGTSALIAIDRFGGGKGLKPRHAESLWEAESLTFVDRLNRAWIRDGALEWKSGELEPPFQQLPGEFLSSAHNGVLLRNADGAIEWRGAPDSSDLQDYVTKVLEALAELKDDPPVLLRFFVAGTAEIRLTVLTESNTLHTWRIALDGSRYEHVEREVPEPLVEIAAGGYNLGGWTALSASGNVYVEGYQGFSEPVEELSPAIKIRANNGVVAAQKADGTWKASGQAKTLVERINQLGPAVDIDFSWSSDHSALVWLAPELNDPSDSSP